ncbi:MAG: membrane dipeptidase [Pseudohongiellaceae bacterium]|jgi:membrane dipeptidase
MHNIKTQLGHNLHKRLSIESGSYSSNYLTKSTFKLGLVAVVFLASCSEQSNDPTNLDADSIQPNANNALTIHNNALVLDAHADIVIPATSSSFLSPDGLSQVDPSKMEAGGVDAVVMSIAVGPGPRTPEGDLAARAEADEKLAAVKALAANSAGKVVIASTSEDIRSAQDNGQLALILGFQNARSLQQSISAIDEFYNAGVRVFALNHLGHNEYSDSSRPFFDGEKGAYEITEEHKGLSQLGRAAIEKINSLGAIVDISQMSKAAAIQTLALTTAPVIASHSNVKAISDADRNLSDEEIDLIGENGGVIHVAAFRAYLLNISEPEFISTLRKLRREAGVSEDYSYPFELYWEIEDLTKRSEFTSAVSDLLGPASVENMVEHIDYIVQRIGIDHVGIGNDFNHGSRIDGYEDASEAANITIALLDRGYSETDIAKIWSGNFLRVLDAAAQKRTQP